MGRDAKKDVEAPDLEFVASTFSCPSCRRQVKVSFALLNVNTWEAYLSGRCTKCKTQVSYEIDKLLGNMVKEVPGRRWIRKPGPQGPDVH